MKICLTSFAAPWFFGPYGQQLKLIANYFLSKNHEVYYLLLSRRESIHLLGSRIDTPDSV